MKTITEFRAANSPNLKPMEVNSSLKYLYDQTFDMDVFLPSFGKNLQRVHVWTIEQKREFIWSLLIRRDVPRLAIINRRNDVYEVIDGKQRLTAVFEYFDDKFSIEIDGNSYFFGQLPFEWQRALQLYYLPYYIVYEPFQSISDQDKIDWFRYINFVGTPQDKEHLEGLLNPVKDNSLSEPGKE